MKHYYKDRYNDASLTVKNRVSELWKNGWTDRDAVCQPGYSNQFGRGAHDAVSDTFRPFRPRADVEGKKSLCLREDSAVRTCSESDSRSSDDSVDMKKSGRVMGPDIKVEYSQSNGVDDWQTDLLVPPRYSSPHPPPRSEYTELPYPRKV